MKPIYIILISGLIFLFAQCATSKKYTDTSAHWCSAAKMEETEVFVDTAGIKRVGTMITAKEKKIFYTPQSKDQHISYIRKKYEELGKAEKVQKWSDFSYSIYESEYDCLNNRFRILSVEDYDSNGVRIIKTVADKRKTGWTNVDAETVADYTFFFVCDYGN